jgi:hypothetical protein
MGFIVSLHFIFYNICGQFWITNHYTQLHFGRCPESLPKVATMP